MMSSEARETLLLFCIISKGGKLITIQSHICSMLLFYFYSGNTAKPEKFGHHIYFTPVIGHTKSTYIHTL